jgi:hypothetical protein
MFNGCIKRLICVCSVWVALQFACGNGSAQINSWTNPASTNWEAPYWSLGVLPDSTQTVMITNAGYKAVGIFPSTALNFPASLTNSNLTVSAPSNALSTLLLNYFGTGTALEVLNSCTIGTNGSIMNLYSAFEVGGQWTNNGGQYVEQGGTTVATNGSTYVLNGGSVNLTNADFKLGQLVLGSFDNPSDTNMVSQVGGQTDCHLTILAGSYTLLSGCLSGECSVTGGYQANFNQAGGTNLADIYVAAEEKNLGFAYYTLSGGTIISSTIELGDVGPASFSQDGGLVTVGSLVMGGNGGSIGVYTMTNGVLQSGTVNIISGDFTQTGGLHITSSPLKVYGSFGSNNTLALHAEYGLYGGDLYSPGVSLGPQTTFAQQAGTNSIAGDLLLSYGAYYVLDSGVLLTSNTELSTNFTFGDYAYDNEFVQQGGEHWITNTLSNLDSYYLMGGSLYASNIVLTGTLFIYSSATIVNPGLFEFGGTLVLYSGAAANLGQMLLSNNSIVQFESGTHTLGFLNSSALAWNSRSTLVVSNWNGSANGGGSDQLIFGNSSSGLTPAQLRQIVFVNPAAFPAGNYPANILPSGEVVPLPNPLLSWQSIRGQLVMSWAGQPTLQSSTNLTGPYMDLTNASSPYTNSQGPYRFFRLRL